MTLRDLIDIPDRVRKSDFVVHLTKDFAQPETLVEQYAITSNLVDAFEQVLGIIRESLNTGKCSGTYVHGSFGSGKSHFMSVLGLILEQHSAPWQLTELHGVLTQHEWVKSEQVLILRIHMLNSPSC